MELPVTPEERTERGLKNIDLMMDAREARCVAEDPARKAMGWAPECPFKGFRFYPVPLMIPPHTHPKRD